MTTDTIKTVLTKENLEKIFPRQRANDFFEALFGDADEGAYDIELAYREHNGSTLVMDLLLRRLLDLGIRLARPGEFSERAFLNGKLDLAQAEAVADLIESGTEAAVRLASRTLRGEER